MDVTKLFETSDDKIEPLELARLDAMIEKAASYPQLQIPANQNPVWIKKVLAIAAAIILAVTISLQFTPVQVATPDIDTSTSDAYSDVSDLLIMETLNDLS